MEDYFLKVLDKMDSILERLDTIIQKNNTVKAGLDKVKTGLNKSVEILETKDYYDFKDIKPIIDKVRQKELNEAQTKFLDSVFSYALKHGKVSAKQYTSVKNML